MSRTIRNLILCSLLGTCVATVTGAVVSPGAPAPPMSLQDLDGKMVSTADFRGRPILVHFWATWCPACVREMSMVEEFSRAHASAIVVLGVNLGERRKVVAAYVQQQGLTFPILLDTRGKAASAFGVTALPATVLVSPAGVVSKIIPMGSLSLTEIERTLDELATAH